MSRHYDCMTQDGLLIAVTIGGEGKGNRVCLLLYNPSHNHPHPLNPSN